MLSQCKYTLQLEQMQCVCLQQLLAFSQVTVTVCVGSSVSEYLCNKPQTPTPLALDVAFVSAFKLPYFSGWGLFDVMS